MSDGPLHILLTDPHSDGGGQVRYVQNLAGELRRMGHAVTIGCRPGSVLVGVAEETGSDVLDVFHFARGMRPVKWGSDICSMKRFLRAARPDIVHVNGSQDHWVAALAGAFFDRSARILRTRHNTYSVKRGTLNRWLNATRTLRQIAVCEMVRRTLAEHPAFDASRLTAIHNGVDTARYAPDTAMREQIRAEFGYGDDDIVFGIAARLVEAKGHTYLFEAVAQIAGEVPALRVLVLGQGALESVLKDQVQRLGLASRVHFAGFRSDMERCVHAFDVGVLPSIDCDTSSFSLKEQMSAGIPVVTSDYGGLPEIVCDGREGRVVPHGTIEPLARALVELAASPALRRQMGEAGRARVLSEFSLRAFAERTVDVYRNLLETADEHSSS
jgi:glycosyltransferase involved in cell wall biosynthesis